MNTLNRLIQLPGSSSAVLHLQSILIFLLAYLVSATMCGYFRAWTALQFGDDTGESSGYLTLNPLAHIDPVGLICIIIFHIGFGKTVPINPFNITGKWRTAKVYCAFLSSTGAHLAIALTGLILITFVPPIVCTFAPEGIASFSPSFSLVTQTLSAILLVFIYLNALLAAISFIVDMFIATMMLFFYDTFLEMGGWSSLILIVLPLMLIYLCAQKLGSIALYFLCTLVQSLSSFFGI